MSMFYSNFGSITLMLPFLKVAAHEMGHNFGMSHDFDAKHGGEGGPCDGQGIMSYNNDKPMQWSSCSVSDFTGYYNSKDWGNTCLKGSYLLLK